MGGAGQNIERRYGKLTNGLSMRWPPGGSLRQLFGLGGFHVGGPELPVGHGRNPAPARRSSTGRLTTPLFGLGLVDSLPDGRFDTLASREPAAIRGIVNRVRSRCRTRPMLAAHRRTRVGRFGWKAGVPNLGQFAADAYLNEMGITTSSCSNGVANRVLRHGEPRQPRRHQRRHQRLPRRSVPGTDDDFAPSRTTAPAA